MKRPDLDNILFILILIFTSYFLVLNISKLKYAYEKTFVTPRNSEGRIFDTTVLQVKVQSGEREYRKSFIKHAIQDKQGNNIVFMDVPIQVNFDDVDIWFNENHVQEITRTDQHVIQAQKDNTIVYIINRDHAEETMSILSGIDYIITSEFPY